MTDLDGKTIVVSDDDQPKVLALNALDEEFAASAAVVEKELFLRGKKTIYCIADDSGF